MTEPADPKSEAGRAPDAGDHTAGPEEVPEWLGTELRRMFAKIISEPIPRELEQLLRELAQRDRERR